MRNEIPSQKEEVMMWFEKHGAITALEAFNKLYIIDLASIIRTLRKVYRIDDVWIEKTNFYGRQTRYKKYIFVGKKQLCK